MWPSPNKEPKPTDQSCSNLISRVFLQTFLGCFLFFDQPSKLTVVHLRQNLKFRFSKKKWFLTIFIKFSGFIEHSKPNYLTLSYFIGKFPEKNLYFAWGAILTKEKNCNLKLYNLDHKLQNVESYIEILPVVLELGL